MYYLVSLGFLLALALGVAVYGVLVKSRVACAVALIILLLTALIWIAITNVPIPVYTV